MSFLLKFYIIERRRERRECLHRHGILLETMVKTDD